jgi:threonine dehydrogenase-like Zn-dependent dehydrogenase
MAVTDGRSVDVAVEAVGMPETFDMATQIVPPAGRVANVGVHEKPVALRLQDLWIHSITISMGLVNTNSTPMLLRLVADGMVHVDKFASPHFKLADMLGRVRDVRPCCGDEGTEGRHRAVAKGGNDSCTGARFVSRRQGSERWHSRSR